MLSSLFGVSLVLGMTFLFVSSSALPRTPENNVLPGHRFSSAQFKDTDAVCASLYRNWISNQEGNASRKTRSGITLPLVISWYIRIQSQGSIRFDCKDFRTDGVRTNAMRTLGELAGFGPFYLQCDPSKEEAKEGSRPSIGQSKFQRTIGVCKPLSGTEEIAPSAEIESGSASCVQGQASGDKFASLQAFMDTQDDNPGDFSKEQYDQFAEWLSIEQLDTSRQKYIKGESTISVSVDHTRKSTYRACAKQRPGHGNARLHLVGLST